MSERLVSIVSAGHRLHAILREPVRPPVRGLVVLCDPFAEEKKCAHRPLVDVARELSRAGLGVLRFDYRGCGDSAGDFADFTPADWLADLNAAIEYGKAELGLDAVGLAGLRMGANLAEQAARSRPDVAWLMLWEPILSGKQYVSQNLRRSLIKAMLTAGDEFNAQTVTQAHAQAAVDFDGYQVSAEMRAQLEGLSLQGAEQAFGGPTLVLNIGARDEPGDAYVSAAAGFSRGAAKGLRLEPFWNRIGLVDVSALSRLSLEWLSETR